jgi:hypothetical protein
VGVPWRKLWDLLVAADDLSDLWVRVTQLVAGLLLFWWKARLWWLSLDLVSQILVAFGLLVLAVPVPVHASRWMLRRIRYGLDADRAKWLAAEAENQRGSLSQFLLVEPSDDPCFEYRLADVDASLILRFRIKNCSMYTIELSPDAIGRVSLNGNDLRDTLRYDLFHQRFGNDAQWHDLVFRQPLSEEAREFLTKTRAAVIEVGLSKVQIVYSVFWGGQGVPGLRKIEQKYSLILPKKLEIRPPKLKGSDWV